MTPEALKDIYVREDEMLFISMWIVTLCRGEDYVSPAGLRPTWMRGHG
jgi:hypothetical protein